MGSLWLSDVVILLALLAASEVMFRFGRAGKRVRDDSVRSQIAAAEAATFGLLALLMGFTLSMAEGRFNWRRQFVLQEAAAVGTTYLRTEFLPEPARSESKTLLRDYVDARRAYYEASASGAPATTARAQEIQDALWSRISVVAREHLDSDVIALYVDSLNQMIDLEGMRDVSITARLPWTIRTLLVFVALVAVGLAGYGGGLAERRVGLTIWLFPVLIAFAFSIIADLDRSREGLISTGDMPMMRLQDKLRHEPAISTQMSAPSRSSTVHARQSP